MKYLMFVATDPVYVFVGPSLSSFVGFYEVAAYTASKSAVAGLTRALSVEWAPAGVTVNGIVPGVFRTDLNHHLLDSSRGQELLMRTPMQRLPSSNSASVVALVSMWRLRRLRMGSM